MEALCEEHGNNIYSCFKCLGDEIDVSYAREMGAPILITDKNKHLVTTFTNTLPEHLDWMLSSPVRFHKLRLYYDSYRGQDGDGPVRGWLISWNWLPGVDEETKDLIRQRDARRHPSRSKS